MGVSLWLVQNQNNIQESFNKFTEQVLNFVDDSRKLISHTSYWVYDPNTGNFAPSKFVGFQGMDFEKYIRAKRGDRDRTKGVRFNGTLTRESIEKILGPFRSDPDFDVELERWGWDLFKADIFKSIDKSKWRFVSLTKKSKRTIITEKIKGEYRFSLQNISATGRQGIVNHRVGQNILRKYLLEVYANKCAMCAVDDASLLRVSHIIPWAENEKTRLDITNTILLCGLHDLAFENKIITISDDYSIVISNTSVGVLKVLETITFSKLNMPIDKQFYPYLSYLGIHRLKT